VVYWIARVEPGDDSPGATKPSHDDVDGSSSAAFATILEFAHAPDLLAARDFDPRMPSRGCARRSTTPYWLTKDRTGGFPEDFFKAFAASGWLGICIPENLWRRGARHHRRPPS